MDDTRRLFFALWPEHKIRAQFAELVQQHAPKHTRPVQSDNLHATLIFLGNQAESLLPEIQSAASDMKADAFQLCLDHLEIWKRSQVMSLCPTEVPESLFELHEGLKHWLESLGVEIEARRYRPHVTLARKLRKKVPLPDIQPIGWKVSEFVLLESLFEQAGVRYQVLDRWQLR